MPQNGNTDFGGRAKRGRGRCYIKPCPRAGRKQMPTPSQPLIITAAASCFFFRFFAQATFFPYIAPWLNSNGFDNTQRSLFLGLYFGGRAIAPFFWGWLADATSRHRTVYAIGTVLNTASIALLTLKPTSAAWQGIFLAIGGLSETLNLLDAIVNRSLLYVGASGPIARAFGSLTYAAASPCVGVLIDKMGYREVFLLYLLTLFTIPLVALLPVREAYDAAAATMSKGATDLGVEVAGGAKLRRPPADDESSVVCLLRQLRRPDWALLVIGFMIGLYYAFANSYCFIMLMDRLDATNTQLGVTISFQAVLEFPLFLISTSLLSCLGGRLPAMLSCLLASAYRLLGYVVVQSFYQILAFEPAHAWIVAMQYAALLSFGEDFSAAGLQATAIGAANSSIGIGLVVGTLSFGAIVDAIGLMETFTAVIILLACGSLPLLCYMLGCWRRALGGGMARDGRTESSQLLDAKRPLNTDQGPNDCSSCGVCCF